MKLTKYTHAAVVLEKDGKNLVIDPGAYTPDSPALVKAADAVIFTHDHPDHIDDAAIEGVDVPIYASAETVSRLGRGTVLADGDTVQIAGFEVTVYGAKHAPIWGDIPGNDNVAVLIDGTVYHPGDSYVVPGVPVDTLLVPTSGPWWKLGEAIDFVQAVKPRQSIEIHELMASDAGRGMTAQMLGGVGGVPLQTITPGDSVTI